MAAILHPRSRDLKLSTNGADPVRRRAYCKLDCEMKSVSASTRRSGGFSVTFQALRTLLWRRPSPLETDVVLIYSISCIRLALKPPVELIVKETHASAGMW